MLHSHVALPWENILFSMQDDSHSDVHGHEVRRSQEEVIKTHHIAVVRQRVSIPRNEPRQTKHGSNTRSAQRGKEVTTKLIYKVNMEDRDCGACIVVCVNMGLFKTWTSWMEVMNGKDLTREKWARAYSRILKKHHLVMMILEFCLLTIFISLILYLFLPLSIKAE